MLASYQLVNWFVYGIIGKSGKKKKNDILYLTGYVQIDIVIHVAQIELLGLY